MDDLRRPWDCLRTAPHGARVAIKGSGVRWLVVDYTAGGLLVLSRPYPTPPYERWAFAHPTAVVILELP